NFLKSLEILNTFGLGLHPIPLSRTFHNGSRPQVQVPFWCWACVPTRRKITSFFPPKKGMGALTQHPSRTPDGVHNGVLDYVPHRTRQGNLVRIPNRKPKPFCDFW